METLRHYERRGLLPRPQWRASGQREYTLEGVRLVLAVKAAQRLGFTLAETREIVWLAGRRGGSDPASLREQVEAKLREVEGRIRGLGLMRAELRAVIAAECDTLIDCDCGDESLERHKLASQYMSHPAADHSLTVPRTPHPGHRSAPPCGLRYTVAGLPIDQSPAGITKLHSPHRNYRTV